jgi:hypothetical protein
MEGFTLRNYFFTFCNEHRPEPEHWVTNALPPIQRADPMMAPDYHAQPVRFSAPGIGHGQVDGSPREGGAAVRNGVPVVSLHLGEGDGQPVLEVSDPQYLSQLISAAVVAHGRLTMFPARTAPAA